MLYKLICNNYKNVDIIIGSLSIKRNQEGFVGISELCLKIMLGSIKSI